MRGRTRFLGLCSATSILRIGFRALIRAKIRAIVNKALLALDAEFSKF